MSAISKFTGISQGSLDSFAIGAGAFVLAVPLLSGISAALPLDVSTNRQIAWGGLLTAAGVAGLLLAGRCKPRNRAALRGASAAALVPGGALLIVGWTGGA